jgi:ABC-type multidrug transport system permease subunit
VATGTIGLLIPLNTMFAGIGVLFDRESGAQRELLAAPIPRGLLVLANLMVAFAITALQITVLLVVARARGIHFDVTATGFLWFAAGGALFTIAMYGMAETLAARVPSTEEYIGRVPAIAIVPWFLAGSLFPIGALPVALTWFARFLPLTHALALVRYGLLDDSSGLHGIWRIHSTSGSAALSLGVVALFALVATRVGVRAFTKRAVG